MVFTNRQDIKNSLQGNVSKNVISNMHPVKKTTQVKTTITNDTKNATIEMSVQLSSEDFTIAFSKHKNKTIFIMLNSPEKMPHSPKKIGSYILVRIGVTKIGNKYIRILLEANFNVFLTTLELLNKFNMTKKIQKLKDLVDGT